MLDDADYEDAAAAAAAAATARAQLLRFYARRLLSPLQATSFDDAALAQKRAPRAPPFSGGFYGKRSGAGVEGLSRVHALSARAIPPMSGGFYGR